LAEQSQDLHIPLRREHPNAEVDSCRTGAVRQSGSQAIVLEVSNESRNNKFVSPSIKETLIEVLVPLVVNKL
jgi:hypothetical protein